MRREAWIVVLAVSIAAGATADNLLVNPGFDTVDQLNGWTCDSTYGGATWSAEDRLGSPASGSMQHDIAAPADSQRVRCSQCVPVTGQWFYSVDLWYLWPDDPDVDQVGTTRASFAFYSDPGCGTHLADGDVAVGFVTSLDTWLHLASDEVYAPAGTVSAKVFVFTWQNDAGDAVRARLDDIVLSSSTPIFGDGFESGDTGRWSTAVP